jgi:hypothetical protein
MGIYKSWAEGRTISSKLLIKFSLGWTSIGQRQFLPSTKYFQSAAIMGRRNTISQPS